MRCVARSCVVRVITVVCVSSHACHILSNCPSYIITNRRTTCFVNLTMLQNNHACSSSLVGRSSTSHYGGSRDLYPSDSDCGLLSHVATITMHRLDTDLTPKRAKVGLRPTSSSLNWYAKVTLNKLNEHCQCYLTDVFEAGG